jgi:D-alanyl-D-alanine carboxypeptidase/D-alanyl-D-alanine-endopeptidase (penicillin-binding protein 4)
MLRARRSVVLLAASAALASASPAGAAPVTPDPPAATARPAWMGELDALIGDRPFSVSIGDDGEVWYAHRAWVQGPPASNQKLLLSMVLMDRFPMDGSIATEIRTDAAIVDGVLRGDLWLVGHGDAEVTGRTLGGLAEQLQTLGVRKIAGGVIGSTGPFSRDWWAPGWRDYFPDVYIARPTALTFDQNRDGSGTHVSDPERLASKALTGRLRALGIAVREDAGMGAPPGRTRRLGVVRSAPLDTIIRHMNVRSNNFRAEVLGKWLAARSGRTPTIANGAAVVCAWIARRGPLFTCNDASGLSYANRATTRGIVELLWFAGTRPWGPALRLSLPSGGTGTLSDPDRLTDVTIRAKTGTLQDASALSGWVRSEIDGRWLEFSVLSNHFDDATAKGIEDQIVRIIAAEATDPTP